MGSPTSVASFCAVQDSMRYRLPKGVGARSHKTRQSRDDGPVPLCVRQTIAVQIPSRDCRKVKQLNLRRLSNCATALHSSKAMNSAVVPR